MKKKIIFAFLLAVIMTFSVCLFAACEEEKEPEKYTVTFDSNGGSSVAAQTVEYGKKATEPTAPTKDGYNFDGWYVGTEKWSFIGHVVTEDMTLTAKWSCAHTLIYIPEKAPQCNADGNIGYWSCSVCSKYFSNFNATSEITDKASVNLSIVDCVFINRKCKWCGGSAELSYTLSSDSTYYTVSGIGACADTDVIILGIYNGKPVTSIGDWAFSRCTGLTSITIPNSVTSIGSYAFSGCKGLTSVTIGNGVTSIGEYAFYNCTGLTSVTIGNGVKSIGEDAFYNTGYYNNNTNWENNVLYIGKHLIKAKTISGAYTIKDGTLGIADRAFYNCTGLTSITIPDSVTSIGDWAFSDCTGLTSISVSENNTAYKSIDGILYSKDGTKLIQYPFGKTDSSFVIPDSVTSIDSDAFYGCTGLTSVTIGNGVKSIGDFAFSGCTGLTSVTIGDGVTSIGDWAFEDCTGLTSITIPNSVTSIGDFAFFGCTGLTSVTIPDSVTSIGYDAFYNIGYYNNNTNWENNVLYIGKHLIKAKTISGAYTIKDGTLGIADSAFSGCTGLTSITIPNSVTSIGEDAFSRCTGLTSITIPDSVTSIGRSAFYNCTGLTNVTIPNSVTSIGDFAFSGCTGLTSVTIPNSVTSIGDWAFEDCTGLTSVTIPNSVTSIGEYAFRNCTGLTSVTIPNSVTSIGNSAFSDCTGLTSVTILNGVTSIGDWAFEGCTGLTSVKYRGTEAQWNAISKGYDWDYMTGNYTITYNYTGE